MDEAIRMRALEPFFSTKGIGKGTGLGLSSAHGLASQLGGALTITSQVGVGTNVEIWIPVSSEPLREEQLDTATSALPFADTVLLVDDDQLVRSSTADMLGSLGYEVIEAVSAEHALQLIDSGSQPGLVLTDHLMSGMTGAELLTVLKLKLPNTLSLLVSGYANVDGIAPDLPRLTKPFTSDELVTSLAGLQSKRSIHDEQIE
jgi:CheY-like chemotaxis protein